MAKTATQKKATVRKQFTAKTQVDDDEGTVIATISTAAVDRDHEILLPKGVQLTQYRKNPVVQWAHDFTDTPIAKALWIKKSADQLVAKLKFAATEKAQEVYGLFKGGFLHAFSVGFLPVKSHAPKPDEVKRNPAWAEAMRIYDKWELLEFSAVPVPSNPEALATSVKSHELNLSAETLDELDMEIDDAEIVLCGADDGEENNDGTAYTSKQTYNCECIECGHKLETEKHCKDIKCPECGGQMRRAERPGPGQANADEETSAIKLDVNPVIEKADIKPIEVEEKVTVSTFGVANVNEMGCESDGRLRGKMFVD